MSATPRGRCQLSDIIFAIHRVDPNRNQNRIPSQTELATLRSIRLHKCQLADTTKQQLEQAKEVHARIQTRHDSLLRELEAAQSELNISHNYLVTLEQQLKTLQEEDHNLAGLLHPIRQCPEDIIRLIFECAAYGEESPLFAVATALSHVCRRWRAIALSISGLWSRIDMSMKPDLIDNLRSFME